MRLEGKVVAITGAGSGLGREGAKLFASEGATVVVSDVDSERANRVAQEIGGQAVAVRADVRDEKDMTEVVAAAVKHFGRLDVMWANAGVAEPGFGSRAFVDTTTEDWNNLIAINLTGIYLAFREAAKQLIAQGDGGCMLATTSAAAFVAYPHFPLYSATKAGGNGMVRSAAFELGEYGIRVNAICPTHGMSINFALPEGADVVGKSYEEMTPWEPAHRAMPLNLGRPPTIRDNANLALFLISDDSAYMSGQSIQSVDGGTFARPAIVFPADRGEDASDLLPSAVREAM